MARRRPFKPQRQPVFLAGEGLSERGYGSWLKRLAVEHRVLVAIRADELGGGDPLDLVNAAVAKWRHADRTGTVFRIRVLFLDTDLFGSNPDRDARAIAQARKHSFQFIRQKPNHEAFLLRHFSGQQSRKPADASSSIRLLRRVWPEYEKGMNATIYEKKLTLDHLARARSVEPELNEFLNRMGWI